MKKTTLNELHQNITTKEYLDDKTIVRVSMSTSSIAAGAREVMRVLQEEIALHNLDHVVVQQTGEKGLQSFEPVVMIETKNHPRYFYRNVTPEQMKWIVIEHLMYNNPIDELVFHTEE